mgnify:CR=1 FL=1
MQDWERYPVNNVTADRNNNGYLMVHFGGDPDQPNFLYTPVNWTYLIWLYQSHEEAVDGRDEFPEPQLVE